MSTPTKEALLARAYVSLYTRVLEHAAQLIEVRDRRWVVDASQVIGWPAPEMPLGDLLKPDPVAVVWPEAKPSNVIRFHREAAKR